MSIAHFQTTTGLGEAITLQARSITAENTGVANVGIFFDNDGTLRTTGTTAPIVSAAEWTFPKVANVGSRYTVEATQVSGQAPSTGVLNSQLVISSTRSWFYTQTAVGIRTGVVRFTLRTGTLIVAQADVTFSAQSTP